jgi:predicted ATP-grasp superfamily ATP-dependent carboligase
MELEESARSPGGAASSPTAPPDASRVVSQARLAARPTVLLVVAAQFSLPYRVLRCLEQAGANVIVLGRGAARGLRTSRCCRRYIGCESQIDGRLNVELVREVNRAISTHSIDLVVAGDPLATRALIEISKVLDAPCFPMPDLEAFDLLNDKWRFTTLCQEMGILCPESRLFANGRQLLDEIDRGAVSLPIIAKPLSEDASRGCVSAIRPGDTKKIARITYGPIIVQEFISGLDIGASIFCREGQIISYLVHDYYHGTYRAYSDPAICATLAKIAGRLQLNGIYNFDMRLAASGEVFFLECNPRVFFKCAMSMVAGINFLGLGLSSGRPAAVPSLVGPVAFQFPRNILRVLFTPWKFNRRTWNVVTLLLADPVPYLREILGLERGH